MATVRSCDRLAAQTFLLQRCGNTQGGHLGATDLFKLLAVEREAAEARVVALLHRLTMRDDTIYASTAVDAIERGEHHEGELATSPTPR